MLDDSLIQAWGKTVTSRHARVFSSVSAAKTFEATIKEGLANTEQRPDGGCRYTRVNNPNNYTDHSLGI
jgi:hypothetical protein